MTRDAAQLDAAIEQGTPPDAVAGSELARDLRIVEMLRTRGAAFDPAPDARARARARLRAAMAEAAPQAAAARPVLAGALAAGAHGSPAEPSAAELTAPFPVVRAADAPTVAAGTDPVPAARRPADDTAVQHPVRDTAVQDTVRDPDEDGADRDTAAGRTAVHAPDVAGSRRGSRHGRASRPAGRAAGSTAPGARGLRRRVAAVVAASLVALVALAFGGDLASRSALPGDALYALKRTAEDVGLATTFDEQARAQRHLELATARVDEVEQLVARDSATGVDPALVESAIAGFDSSTGEGSRALLAAQDASGPAVLGDLQAWASEQAARLSALRSALPAPAVGEVDSSLALLDRLLGRTAALEARSSCTEVTSSVVDDLGPLAAEGSCTPRAGEIPGLPGLPDLPADDPLDGTVATTAPDGGSGGGGAGGTAVPGDRPRERGSAPTEDERPGLLPDLGTDGLPLTGGDATTSDPGTPDDGDVSVPLPLVPPIQLPPLVPGLPGVSIG